MEASNADATPPTAPRTTDVSETASQSPHPPGSCASPEGGGRVLLLDRLLSDLTCLEICLLLALVFDRRAMGRLARKYNLVNDDEPRDFIFSLIHLHSECHGARSPFALAFTQLMNRSFDHLVAQVRNAHTVSVPREQLARMVQDGENPVGVLWALATDPRDPMRNLGHHEGHRIFMEGIEAWKRRHVAASARGAHGDGEDSLARQAQLEARLRRMADNLERQKSVLRKAEARIAELERENAGLLARVEKFEHQSDREIVLTQRLHQQELRMEAISRANRELRQKQVRARPPEPEYPTDSVEPTTPMPPAAAPPGSQGTAQPLAGHRVAVVGGLERMEQAYRETVEELGGHFLYHNGTFSSGSNELKQVAACADFLVFVTTVNSHNALKVAKKVCKKVGTRFCATRRTGSSGLRRTLIEASRMDEADAPSQDTP